MPPCSNRVRYSPLRSPRLVAERAVLVVRASRRRRITGTIYCPSVRDFNPSRAQLIPESPGRARPALRLTSVNVPSPLPCTTSTSPAVNPRANKIPAYPSHIVGPCAGGARPSPLEPNVLVKPDRAARPGLNPKRKHRYPFVRSSQNWARKCLLVFATQHSLPRRSRQIVEDVVITPSKKTPCPPAQLDSACSVHPEICRWLRNR